MTEKGTEVFVSAQDMGSMIDKRFLDHLTEAVLAFNEPITITEAEMTVAGFLAMEIGNSCNTLEEVDANSNAYYRLIKDLARFTFKVRMSRN